VLIDDFGVPGDAAYGYDRYGDTALEVALIAPVLRTHRLQAFFPTQPGVQETGARRGCVVLAPAARAARLAGVPLLKVVETP
jgi:hypothetical protein